MAQCVLGMWLNIETITSNSTPLLTVNWQEVAKCLTTSLSLHVQVESVTMSSTISLKCTQD